MKIRNKLLLLIIIFIFSFIVIEMIIYININANTKDRTIKYVLEIMQQMNNNISKYLDDSSRIAKSMAYNKDLQNFLSAGGITDRIKAEARMHSFMENIKLLKDNIVSIFIFYNDSYINYGEIGNIHKN